MYRIIVKTRKLAFAAADFHDAYKTAYSLLRRYGETVVVSSLLNEDIYIFAIAFQYECVIYGGNNNRKTFALRPEKEEYEK